MKKRPVKRSPRQRELRGRRAALKRKAKPRFSASSHPAFPRSANANKPADWVRGEDYASRVEQPSWPANKIKIGKRHRKDLGDIKALANDINERGLLHPIVVDLKNNLIAGERRLAAWKLSNFRDQAIPIHTVPLDDIVAGEWAENDPALRKNFTPSEAVAIARELRPRLEAAAEKRKRQGNAAGGKVAGKLEDTDKGKTREKIAKVTGKGARTLEKAEAIVEAAEANPSRFGKLKKRMDETGRVDGPFKQMQTMKAAEQIRKEPPPLPNKGPYRGIVADPPWAAEPDDEDPARLERGYYPYPTMTPAQIAAIPVASIAHDDCVLGLWITNYHLARGDQVEILKAWGFEPVTIRSWVKDRMGRGQVLRGQTEHCIIATRGKPVIQVDNITTFFHGAIDKKQHSLKPSKFFNDFERLVAAPRYATLFETVDRGPRWDGHGDKVAFKEAAE